MFQQSEMMYRDYYWGFRYLPKDPHTCGELGTTIFTRTEGPQMLYFLNKYAELRHWKHHLHNRLQKLEYIVRERVPDSLDYQYEVRQWLDENMKRLWYELVVSHLPHSH